jgi:uncharacterized membrane protein YdjX (TVP38/TMEM64 family)
MRKYSRLIAGLAAVAVLVLAARWLGHYVPRFTAMVDGMGVWGPVVFIAGYIVAVVLFVPASLFTIAGGAVFGFAHGTLYVLIGAVIGASAGFGLSRSVARRIMERRIGDSARFRAIDQAVADQGLRIVTLLRLSPIVPFSVLNYALGLTRVRFADYLVGMIGMVPATMFYVYYGTVAGALAARLGGAPASVPKSPVYYALVGTGIVATVVVSVVISRLAGRALAAATPPVADGRAP